MGRRLRTTVRIVEGLVVGLAVLTLAVGAFFVWRWRRKRRIAEILSECDALRSTWSTAERNAVNLIATAESLVDELVGPSNDKAAELASRLQALLDEARTAMANLPTSIEAIGSPGDAEALRSGAAKRLSALGRQVTKAEVEIDSLADRLAKLPDLRDDASEAITKARRAASAIADRGWRVEDIQADLDGADEELATLDTEPPFDLGAIEKQLVALISNGDALADQATGRPDQHRKLVEAATGLTSRTEELRADTLWLVNQLEAWSLIHHKRSLVSVSEHPPAVTGRVDEAQAILDSVLADGGMLAMDSQDLRGASNATDRAFTLVEQSAALIAEARALNVELATAAVEAETRLGAADDAIAQLRSYVDKHHYDLRERFAAPVSELASDSTESRSSLDLDPPDRLGAMRCAARILRECGERRSAAEAEVARMNKLRSQAAKAIGRAQAAVGELDRYTAGFFADVFGSSRRNEVERLRRRIGDTERLNQKKVNKPEEARRNAESIANESRKLLADYKRRDEEERRRRMADD